MKRNEAALDPQITEAEENSLIDWQFLVLDLINAKGVSRSELAKRAGISRARLSQILSAEANPTVKTFARLFLALGAKVAPQVVQDSRSYAMPLQPEIKDGWEVEQAPEPALPKSRRAKADSWFGASNDNYVSVDSDASSVRLRAA
jgi:transcriptional regulator with XRE-family HTH domain